MGKPKGKLKATIAKFYMLVPAWNQALYDLIHPVRVYPLAILKMLEFINELVQ